MANCRVILGDRGAGKSEMLKNELLHVAKDGECAVLAPDPPGTMATEMMGQLSAHGMEERAIIEIARDTKTRLQWPFTEDSLLSGDDARIANEIMDEMFCQAFWSSRMERSGMSKPYTKRYLEAAAAIFRSRDVVDIKRMLDVFNYPSLDFHDALSEAKDEAAVSVFRELARRAGKSRKVFNDEAGASARLVWEVVNSPVIYLRHGKGFDWLQALREKKQIYFDLSGVKKSAARSLTLFATHAAIAACIRHFNETGKPLNTIICLEEAGGTEILAPFILDSMRMWRKAGVYVWVASQTIFDFSQETLESLLSLTERHDWMHINAGIDRAAKDLADPTFNPYEVYYTRETLHHDGYDEIKNVSKGRRKGPDGNWIEDTREGITYLGKYRPKIEETYKTPQLHEQEFKTKLAQLKKGERFVKDYTGVRKEYVPMLEEPWPLGLTDIRTRKAIARIRSSHHFFQVHVSESTGKNSDGSSTSGSESTPAPSTSSTTCSLPETPERSTSPKPSESERSTSSDESAGRMRKAEGQETSTPPATSDQTKYGMNWQEPS